jgi:UDP-GlcNAc:undecaprenyl-phosphate GlcNAc-1-phosphate transferase
VAYYIAGLFILLFIAEIVYFKIADKFNIIDKPNKRSSHTQLTIRGGGIVFLLAGLIFAVYSGFELPWLWIGFILIASISFIDDLKTLSSSIRLPVQLVAVMFLIYQCFGREVSLWIWLAALILATGIINAYNFMDGINGITAGYSLVFLMSIILLNQQLSFTDDALLIAFVTADIVFGVFNFRIRARCFAGDVGSVSIAFIVVFLLFSLIQSTQNFFYIMLLAVYGVDSVLTIVYRLRNGENIFQAHRSHLYQWLVNPGSFNHLQISGLYMAIQAMISLGVILLKDASLQLQVSFSVLVLFGLGIAYVAIKSYYKRKYELV